MARYNNYTTIILGKSWGGPGMEGNNYYWGYWENELNWAIATYYENPMAQTYLNDALVTRWQNGVLPYFAGPDQGGVTPEGTEYGPEMLSYTVMPFHDVKFDGTGPSESDQLVQRSGFQLDL